MKTRKRILSAILSFAMVLVMTPVNTVFASDAVSKFIYDCEANASVSSELSSYFIREEKARDKKTGNLKFAAADTVANIPMEIISSGTALFEIEMDPAGKTSQSIVFKNSNGEALLIVANNIASADTGTVYVADTVATKVDDENVKHLAELGTFDKNSWIKVKVEIDLAKASYKVNTIKIGKYTEDESTWTNLGEATNSISGVGKFDLAKIELHTVGSNRFIGDISLSVVGEGTAAAQTEIVKSEETKKQTETVKSEETKKQTETVKPEETKKQTEIVKPEETKKPTEIVKPEETKKPAETVKTNGNTYTVKKGDTLCAIARNLFNNETKWSDIYNWNSKVIKDANFIYEGQVLVINK